MASGTHLRVLRRLRLSIGGAVQGVGFRPFVYRLATDLELVGWVCNTTDGLSLEVEGPLDTLNRFKQRVAAESPPQAHIQRLEAKWLTPCGYTEFTIAPSEVQGAKSTVVLPDIATCQDCLDELYNPHDRRYLYPFTNCTNCGPRFSIIEALPYDRLNTTMRHFDMCGHCQAEYNDPHNRRFHAQPNACPECGPSLAWWDCDGACLSTHHHAMLSAVDAIRQGDIVAVKGLGGFHLMLDARNEDAIRRLRQAKYREEKPLAIMLPSWAAVERFCDVGPLEAHLLRSSASPIVLLRRKPSRLPDAIAPGNPNLGVMLPYTPLHHMLMSMLGFPVVATSGNRADEPLCTDEHEALERLAGMADGFLVHNRPIARHLDDSIVQVTLGTAQMLRRARGYAPLPIHWRAACDAHAAAPDAMLAVGAHAKNHVAAAAGPDILLSQYIGDLETTQAFAAFQKALHDIPTLHDIRPTAVACDAHPDYLSSRHAATLAVPLHRVQHHYAHVLACMADNELDAPVLGIAWDGSGYGSDGTIWGGEFLHVNATSFQRVAHFRPFPLPGGERAIKEPRRIAFGLLYTVMADALFDRDDLAPLQTFSDGERRTLQTMLMKHLNSPPTSSVGRLFDAVASLTGLRQISTFEGQAAMDLEFALDGVDTEDRYPFRLQTQQATTIIDWAPLFQALLADVRDRVSTGLIAARFHNTLVEIIVAMARRCGETAIVLTGGCFQNRYLTERAVMRLKDAGFRPYWHQRVPPNDGGIALGQIIAARRHTPIEMS